MKLSDSACLSSLSRYTSEIAQNECDQNAIYHPLRLIIIVVVSLFAGAAANAQYIQFVTPPMNTTIVPVAVDLNNPATQQIVNNISNIYSSSIQAANAAGVYGPAAEQFALNQVNQYTYSMSSSYTAKNAPGFADMSPSEQQISIKLNDSLGSLMQRTGSDAGAVAAEGLANCDDLAALTVIGVNQGGGNVAFGVTALGNGPDHAVVLAPDAGVVMNANSDPAGGYGVVPAGSEPGNLVGVAGQFEGPSQFDVTYDNVGTFSPPNVTAEQANGMFGNGPLFENPPSLTPPQFTGTSSATGLEISQGTTGTGTFLGETGTFNPGTFNLSSGWTGDLPPGAFFNSSNLLSSEGSGVGGVSGFAGLLGAGVNTIAGDLLGCALGGNCGQIFSNLGSNLFNGVINGAQCAGTNGTDPVSCGQAFMNLNNALDPAAGVNNAYANLAGDIACTLGGPGSGYCPPSNNTQTSTPSIDYSSYCEVMGNGTYCAPADLGGHPNGVVSTYADGTQITWSPNQFHQDANGNVTVDGGATNMVGAGTQSVTVNEALTGNQVPTVSSELPNTLNLGNSVGENAMTIDGESTITDVTMEANGQTVTTFENGDSEVTYPDGTVVQTDASGENGFIVTPDGQTGEITSLSDTSMQITWENGSTSVVDTSGQNLGDGSNTFSDNPILNVVDSVSYNSENNGDDLGQTLEDSVEGAPGNQGAPDTGITSIATNNGQTAQQPQAQQPGPQQPGPQQPKPQQPGPQQPKPQQPAPQQPAPQQPKPQQPAPQQPAPQQPKPQQPAPQQPAPQQPAPQQPAPQQPAPQQPAPQQPAPQQPAPQQPAPQQPAPQQPAPQQPAPQQPAPQQPSFGSGGGGGGGGITGYEGGADDPCNEGDDSCSNL